MLSTRNWVSEHRKFLQAEAQVGRSLLQSEQIRHLLRAHRDWSYSECLQVVQTYQLSLSVTTGDLILGALVLPAGLSKSEWCPSSSSCRQKVLFTLGRAQKTQVNCILGKAGSSGSKYSPVVLIWFERQRSLFISIYLSSVVLIIHLGWGFSSQKTNNLSRLLSSNHKTASVQCVDKPGPLHFGSVWGLQSAGERSQRCHSERSALKRQTWSFGYFLKLFFSSFFQAGESMAPLLYGLTHLTAVWRSPVARGTRGRQLTLQLTFFD